MLFCTVLKTAPRLISKPSPCIVQSIILKIGPSEKNKTHPVECIKYMGCIKHVLFNVEQEFHRHATVWMGKEVREFR